MNYLDYHKTISIRDFSLSSASLIAAANETNSYITLLAKLFRNIGVDFFNSLGQRNISGFIGEVYKHVLANTYPILKPNPHPDGRPDILVLDTPKIIKYYSSCFLEVDGRNIPVKKLLTPFKYGGLEIKCTIGEMDTKKFIKKYGRACSVYDSRVGFINQINWWAHHNSANNLLGLYYDYYQARQKAPQIIAGFYAKLSDGDWYDISNGNPSNKKTSNTSLNKQGLAKMKSNCVFCLSSAKYQKQMQKLKIKI